ncbi:nucleoid-associated protein [Glaciimonas sp. PAMC28666]|uniref:nucleoid-associated protein n=1 Tax=Glaciimonas sp. PAMC28666 TaxID=2807626 RepID=UPI001964A00E|nr:nucleoid-associated protein [Glaciimonas sp. PAMC28666]QRX82262.1 nucleoid-associated protein [Glaciimonas sp. PAMC28666]
MEVLQAVAHFLNKSREEKDRKTPSTLRLRETLLPINDKVTTLITTLRQLYNEKSGHGYGVFHENLDVYPFSGQLSGHGTADWNFLHFTKRAMGFLQSKIEDVTFATGGYILFADYVENGEIFLLIASLKNRPGFVFDDALELADQEHIDLDHLHEMARVNLTTWRSGGERYISFAKRRSSGDEFSQYFRKFIGCDEFTESRALTRSLLEALNAYSLAKDDNAEMRVKRRQTVFDYCEEKRDAGDRVSLIALSARLSDDEPEAFLNFLNANSQLGVADDFDPDRRVYASLKRFRGGDKKLTLSFDAELLDNRIIYDSEQGTLLIRNLPIDLKKQLDDR